MKKMDQLNRRDFLRTAGKVTLGAVAAGSLPLSHVIAEENAANVAPSPGYRETLRFDEPGGATALPCDTSDPRAVSDAVGSAVRALRGERFADGDILVLFQSSERMAALADSGVACPGST